MGLSRADWIVLKLGGELLEDEGRMRALAGVVAGAAISARLVVVHGGGREVDAALARAGITKRQVEGLRITDAATLDVVIQMLAGTVNTRLVAAITAAGGAAVGLTGADARLVVVERAEPHVTAGGSAVDLGFVGRPVSIGRPALLEHLTVSGYVPVVASLGVSDDGTLYNVNADTLAAHVAGRLGARRLIIAGATPGVLDESGQTIPRLDRSRCRELIASGVASAGMVAKLRACEDALAHGAQDVILVDGREPGRLSAFLTETTPETDVLTTCMVA